MRSILFMLLLFWGVVPVWANSDKMDEQALVHITLGTLDANWWSSLEALSVADKQSQLRLIEKDIERGLEALPVDRRGDNSTVVPQLIAQLTNQYAIAQPNYKVSSQPLPPNSTVENWLVFAGNTHQTERDVVILSEDIARLNLLSKERSKAISKKLIEYRKLPVDSEERIISAMGVLRLQLEQLLSGERMARLKKRLVYLEGLNKTQQKHLSNGVMQLRSDPEQRPLWLNQQQALLRAIETSSSARYSLELEGLGDGRDTLPLSARVEALVLSSQLASQTISLAQLELKMAVNGALDGQGLLMPASQEHSLKQWRVEKAELDRQFNDFFQALDSDVEGTHNQQQAGLWLSLQKVRQYLQVGAQRSREVEWLLRAYSVVSGERQGAVGVGLSQLSLWGSTLLRVGGEMLHYPLFSINESPVTFKDLIGVLLVMVVAALVSVHSRKALVRFGEAKKSISESALFTMGRILHYVIIVAAVLIGFSTLGIDLSKLAIVAGALSVGIGFGLQSIFNNFISGLILLFERPLKVGDLIELESGVRGRIKSINVRSTQVTTWDNIDILVPNSEFISGRVTNYTFSDDLRRLHISFGVAYGSDKELVRQAVLEASDKIPYTLTNHDHKADVWLTNYGESSLDFELVVWVKGNLLPKRGNPKAIYLWEIETALTQHGIEIPFPQRDLHVRSVDKRVLSSMQPVSEKSDEFK